jgi:hypothetical protein
MPLWAPDCECFFLLAFFDRILWSVFKSLHPGKPCSAISAIFWFPALHESFLARQNFPALLSLLSNNKSLSPNFQREVYEHMVRFHFADLIANFQSIPPYRRFIDLMKFIPIDGTGCPRSFFFDLLNNANLVPIRPVRQREVLCAFIFMIHQMSNIRYIERFMKTLDGEDFIFVLSSDKKNRALGPMLLRHFSNQTRVFLVEPCIIVHWSSVTQVYASWMAVSAINRSGLNPIWFSLHSAVDLALRSGNVTREFLRRFAGRAEFYASGTAKWNRVVPFIMSPGHYDCVPCFRRQDVVPAVRHLFPNWTSLRIGDFGWGPSWWLLSSASARDILTFIQDKPEIVLRISFTGHSDEGFVQTILRALGRPPDGFLTFVNWQGSRGGHPNFLREKDIKFVQDRPFLFARKLPPDNEHILNKADLFIAAEKKIGQYPHALSEQIVLKARQLRTNFIRGNGSSGSDMNPMAR